MLKLAIAYESILGKLFQRIAFDDKYKYFTTSNYYDFENHIDRSTWHRMQFVSVDNDDNVIGYLSAKIDRTANNVSSLQVVNFYDLNWMFSKDFHRFIVDLLCKYNFHKINFSVVIGNPAEKMYDKYIKMYGGRIVGTYKNDVKLYDGKFYDLKLYEIRQFEFIKSKEVVLPFINGVKSYKRKIDQINI